MRIAAAVHAKEIFHADGNTTQSRDNGNYKECSEYLNSKWLLGAINYRVQITERLLRAK